MNSNSVTEKLTSESLHNNNCYHYLRILFTKTPDFFLTSLPEKLTHNLASIGSKTIYDPTFPYAELYTDLITHIENNIEQLLIQPRNVLITHLNHPAAEKQSNKKLNALEDFVIAIYNSDNNILEFTFEAIKQIPSEQQPTSHKIETQISKKLRDKGIRINHSQSPGDENSLYNLITGLWAPNFNPQYKTNLPTKRNYHYVNNNNRTELRISTQAQRHNGMERVSPLFELFLEIQCRRNLEKSFSDKKITHLYFNYLGLDRNDIIGEIERKLTQSLHKLEQKHPNVAIITLPADRGIMAKNSFKHVDKYTDYQTIFMLFLDIASQNPSLTFEVKDFFISQSIRDKLFKNAEGIYQKDIELQVLSHHLKTSFSKMGITETMRLSPAEAQAVWFHFIKYELTTYIIESLDPDFFHFTCKDAIDRGGVSSVYYHLMESIKQDNPLTRHEFERGLHAAPAMVKARGMNHHLLLIWNAIDVYVNTHYTHIQENKPLNWLIQWRDTNCPHDRINQLLTSRIEQCFLELQTAHESHPTLNIKIEQGLDIINQIRELNTKNISGKRLLLEAVICTSQIIFTPQPTMLDRYLRIAEKLHNKHPILKGLVGLMRLLLGIILYIPSLGYSKKWITSGCRTINSSIYASDTNKIHHSMTFFCEKKPDLTPLSSTASIRLSDDPSLR